MAIAYIKSENMDEFLKKVTGIDPIYLRRVIIDISIDDIVKVYVEKFASTEMLELNFPTEIKNAEIKILGKEEK